jgi:hypothetical protein
MEPSRLCRSIAVRKDVPMARTIYIPTGVPTVHDRVHFKIFPYFIQKADGTVLFRLLIGVPFFPNNRMELRQTNLTVDGTDSFALDFSRSAP